MNKPNEFNPEIFREVVKVNLNMLTNGITSEAFNQSILIGNPIRTEDETRQMAVDFFRKQLAKELYEHLK